MLRYGQAYYMEANRPKTPYIPESIIFLKRVEESFLEGSVKPSAYDYNFPLCFVLFLTWYNRLTSQARLASKNLRNCGPT